MVRASRFSAACAAGFLGFATEAAPQDRIADAIANCAAAMGLAHDECVCMIETGRTELTERQFDYLVVRVAQDEPEVVRLRALMSFSERIAILTWSVGAAERCAPGKTLIFPTA